MYGKRGRHTRRDFVKSAAIGLSATGLGLAAASRPSTARPARLDEKLGIALVGLGYYSTDVLAPALQKTENVRLTGIVTGTPAKEPVWMEKYGIPNENVYNYQNYDSIAQNDDIDIIYVVLPNAMHAEYTIRALRAGKHVICEKPMASNAKECEAMIEAADEAGKKLAVGYRVQHDPATQLAIEMAQSDDFGPMKLVTAGAGYRERRADHWKLDREMAGGAMMDMGVYSLQGARYIVGEEPISVTAQTFTTRPELFTEVDETTLFQLEFPGGAVANLHTSFGVGMNYLHANATADSRDAPARARWTCRTSTSRRRRWTP